MTKCHPMAEQGRENTKRCIYRRRCEVESNCRRLHRVSPTSSLVIIRSKCKMQFTNEYEHLLANYADMVYSAGLNCLFCCHFHSFLASFSSFAEKAYHTVDLQIADPEAFSVLHVETFHRGL